MPPAAASALPHIEALEAQAQRLMASFAGAGYERISPAVIQPAALFLDAVGEALRARTYVFTDPDGAELCLRPDLTLPTCRLHLERFADAATPARYCYAGSAFRYQPADAGRAHPREFRQAGIESFALPDRERDDAETVALIVSALRDAGLQAFTLHIGDLGLFNALIAAIPMPERWRRRLRHQFWRPDAFRAELQRLTSGAAAQRGLPAELIARLDPDDPPGALVLLEKHLDNAGLEPVGARTLSEIAERLLAAAADAREPPLSATTAALIEAYVAVKAPAREAVASLEALLGQHRIDLGAALSAFQRRLDLLDAAGVDTAGAEFSAEFGRNLEYYTGFVFELLSPALGPKSPVAGGGRYDSLLAECGAARQVPAVGACIHTERLLAVLQGAVS